MVRFLLRFLVLVLTIQTVVFGAAEKNSKAKAKVKEKEPEATVLPPGVDPWTFRKHYTIHLKEGAFDFAEDKCEWRIFSGANIVLSDVTFSVVLGDGRVLTADTFGEAVAGRAPFSSDYGDGLHYTSTFPPKDDIQVMYRLTSFKTRPFLLVDITVTNLGTAPLVVKEINPAILGAAGFKLGAGVTVSSLPLGARGGFLTYETQQPPLFQFLRDAGGKTGIALGVLPQGRARAGIEFQQNGEAWQGRAFSLHEPGVTLGQNEQLSSDAVWISYGNPDFDAVNLYYAWTINSNPHQTYDRPVPKGWVTVAEGGSLAELVALGPAAQSSGLKFALIPAGWEGRPGSLEGGAPRYPRQIAAAARQLKDAGLAAGLTVDPLNFDGGQEGWSAKSPDGQGWLNLSKPEARALVEQRIKALQKNGFEFFAVSRSLIPDSVLQEFNMGRAAADALAVQTVAGAAGGAPVFPSAETAADVSDTGWADSQQRLKPLGDFKVVFAPARLTFSHGAEVASTTVDALKVWPGPLEVVGAPPQSMRGTLRSIFQSPGPQR